MVRAIEDARAACDDHRWGDAWRLLVDARARDASTSTISTGSPPRPTSPATTRRASPTGCAPTRCASTTARVHRAAYFGGKLAQGLGFKGDFGRCRGWVDRTARLLDEASIDCVEQGYLEYGLGDDAALRGRRHRRARTPTSSRPARSAPASPTASSSRSARIGEGRMLIYLGDIAEGMALLDEAMVVDRGRRAVTARDR